MDCFLQVFLSRSFVFCSNVFFPNPHLYFALPFRRSTRELQRLDSISKSPVYAQLSESLGGLATIRAYRSQERFQMQIMNFIDKNNAAFIFTQVAHRWLGLRLDYGGAILVFLAAISSVTAALSGTIKPGLVGLALTYALAVAQVFNWVVRMATEVEMNMNAVERVDHYSTIENEPSPKDSDVSPSEAWPEKGTFIYTIYVFSNQFVSTCMDTYGFSVI